MKKPIKKSINVSIPMELHDQFKQQSLKANKTISQMIREFMRASLDGRLVIKRTFTDYERKLYNIQESL